MKHLLKNLNLSTLLDNISEEGELNIRLDKQSLIGEGKIKLLLNPEHKNRGIYKIKLKFTYFGKKSEKIDSIKTLIKSYK